MSVDKLFNALQTLSQRTNEAHEPSDYVLGVVVNVSPLTIKLEQGDELSGDFLVLTDLVRDYSVDIEVSHTTEDRGGGGGYVSRGYSPNGWQIKGAGGGGGYTSTVLGVDVTPGQEIAVTVGAGGYGYYLDNGVGIFNLNPTNGGTSKIDYDGPLAIGGVATSSGSGARGGSGGGGGGITNFNGYKVVGGDGGIDGGDGGGSSRFSGGKGQGTTTRYFGESTGTLYSTGASGEYASRLGSSKPEVKTDNTGDGGDGNNGKGASGICIIRWSGK